MQNDSLTLIYCTVCSRSTQKFTANVNISANRMNKKKKRVNGNGVLGQKISCIEHAPLVRSNRMYQIERVITMAPFEFNMEKSVLFSVFICRGRQRAIFNLVCNDCSDDCLHSIQLCERNVCVAFKHRANTLSLKSAVCVLLRTNTKYYFRWLF